MFLRFSQILLIYFLLFSYVESAESGGMPQLNPEFWFSQIFWLIITFGFMFVVLSKLVLPKISENLETRKAQISENIESAEKQRLEQGDARDLAQACLREGLVVNGVTPSALRLAPPLTISSEEITEGAEILEKVLKTRKEDAS